MAEMVGTSRGLRRPTSVIGGLLAAIKLYWLRVSWERREPKLRMEDWPDHLLRDIGLGRTAGTSNDPRSLPMDWPLR
jgi:hypothetical protein